MTIEKASSEDFSLIYDHIQWLYHGDKWLFAHRLCIDPGYQGEGYGQQIFRELEAAATAAGFESIRFDVFTTNKISVHINEKYGCVRVGTAVCDRGAFFVYEKLLN